MISHCKDTVPKIGKTLFPERKLLGLSPNFYTHISVSDSYISSAYLAAAKQVNRSWEYINCSQMYEYGNWELGRAVWCLGIHHSNLLWSAHGCRERRALLQGGPRRRRRWGGGGCVARTTTTRPRDFYVKKEINRYLLRCGSGVSILCSDKSRSELIGRSCISGTIE